jgi:hypothetical protein
MKGSEPISFIDTFPIVNERNRTTKTEPHYFYQASWAMRRIFQSRVSEHVDVGSDTNFVGMLAAIMPVTFLDIRPLDVCLPNLRVLKGTILSMPYEDCAIGSLSCLHVLEHVGLGRYGDPLDPNGTKKAAEELSRVLAVDGKLYLSLPIGKPRLNFNAHRVHSPGAIVSYFRDLTLLEFSGVDDRGRFVEDADFVDFENLHYGCGFFLFTKER